ncbi:putative outer membrane efflux protein [Flavobacterium enshiense DK69]|nr:putative outer membrane efflux protein [Flavobacterium enshiense DK69]
MIICGIALIPLQGKSQSTIDEVLSEVSKNNKTIQANEEYIKAQKVQYKTGISLYNPTLEYDYLKGSPANAGNQTDFTISQSFDFPTAYSKKNQLANEQITQADIQYKLITQNLLFEVKKICIELVYRNKLQNPLTKRKAATERWLSNFQRRLKNGDGNILDVNKAEVQLIEIKKEHQENLSEIVRLNEKLTGLNGGNPLVFKDTVYFDFPAIPDFETLEKEIEDSDPMRKFLEQEKLITQKQMEVSKALTLPKMEVGYHYQGILGQTYNGIHTGISLPLWESKNTVKLQKARMSFAEMSLTDHKNDHYYEIKQLYGKYENLKSILNDYQKSTVMNDNIMLLDKALSLGQISSLEYFVELNYYNNTVNSYLKTEKEYFEVISELLKYKL